MTEPAAPRVVVLGSVHMDLIATAARLPDAGESVSGGTFAMVPGGKAGNQACQFALAGARARIVSRLGTDDFGRRLRESLKRRGVEIRHIARDVVNHTGASTIFAAHGDYCSIIAPGAAGHLSRKDVDDARAVIETSDALVLQLELETGISDYAAGLAAAAGVKVILNASPAPEGFDDIPANLLEATTTLVVNRVEAGRLLGRAFSHEHPEADLAALAEPWGIGTVVVTLGADGIVARDAEEGHVVQPALPTEVVDAVGAGDAFLAVFATARLQGLTMRDALRRGAAASALALSRHGVYDALPGRAEIDEFLAAQTPE